MTVGDPIPSPARSRRRRVLLAIQFHLRAVHEGIIRFAHEANWIIDSRMTHTGQVPRRWDGDGVITLAQNPGLRRWLRRLRRPVVYMLSSEGESGRYVVKLNDRLAGRMAAEHLLERGFRHLAYIQPNHSTTVADRCVGFRIAAERGGATFHHILYRASKTAAGTSVDWSAWLAPQLAALPRPVGLFASADSFATYALYACEEAGLSVPEQVAVIGVDNDPLYVNVAPVPLTSVDNDLEGMGYEAARLLDRIMSDPTLDARRIEITPKGVIARRSTDIIAVENPHVARALGYMYGHFRQLVSVEEIGRRSDISLRQLQTLFKRYLGRTPHEQLQKMRIEHAARLLEESGRSIESIARDSGFATGKYLGIVFRSRFGCSPRAWRKSRKRQGL